MSSQKVSFMRHSKFKIQPSFVGHIRWRCFHSLLTVPAARGLFHKTIGESSGGRNGVLTGRSVNKENVDALYPVSAETIEINLARKHKIKGTDADAHSLNFVLLEWKKFWMKVRKVIATPTCPRRLPEKYICTRKT